MARPTNQRKEIHGRKIPLLEIETIKRKITPFGKGGAHLNMPNRHLGRDAVIKVLSPTPFICRGCHESITREENFSPDSELCILCFEQEKRWTDAKGKMKCKTCGEALSKKVYDEMWGCGKCMTCRLLEDDANDKELEDED